MYTRTQTWKVKQLKKPSSGDQNPGLMAYAGSLQRKEHSAASWAVSGASIWKQQRRLGAQGT